MTVLERRTNIASKTLKYGAQRFEARLKREGIEISGTFKNIEDADGFGKKVDILIEGGMSALECKEFLKVKKSKSSPTAPPADLAPTLATETPEGLTVKKAIQNYLTYKDKSHEPIPSNYRTDYERVRDDLGDFPISELRNEDISNYISRLLKTPIKSDARRKANGTLDRTERCYADATVRKFIIAMKIALEWNARNGKAELNKFLFDFNSKTMPSAWTGKRERRLAAGEEEKLYAAGIERGGYTYTSQDWRNIVGFALASAMRQQEIGKALWKHVSEDGFKLHIPKKNTKSKTDRTILLSKTAREIIANQRASCPKDSPRIFHQFTSVKAICDAFARLTARAEIQDLHFHDLRHEGTSRLCISGKLPLMAIMEMTGHKTMTTFRGYVHLITHGDELRLD